MWTRCDCTVLSKPYKGGPAHTCYNRHVISKKVKVTLVQALRLCTGRTAYRESRGTALPFHDHGTRRD